MRMNAIGWILGLVLMIAMPAAMLAGGWGEHGGQNPTRDDYRLEGPFTHGNLSVFLIHGKDKIKGAIRHWVAAQANFETIFCIVDLHALTIPQRPEVLASKIRLGCDPM